MGWYPRYVDLSGSVDLFLRQTSLAHRDQHEEDYTADEGAASTAASKRVSEAGWAQDHSTAIDAAGEGQPDKATGKLQVGTI